MSDKLQEIKERWSNATAGPWKWINNGICLFPQNGFDYGDYIVFIQKSGFGNPHDAEAIVKSPADVSWLIDQLEQAHAQNERLEELVKVDHKIVVHMTEQNQKLVELFQQKIDTLDERIETRKGPNYFDESERIEKFHTEAYVWEKALELANQTLNGVKGNG